MTDKITTLPPAPIPPVSPYVANIYRPDQQLPGTYIPSPDLELAVQAFLIQHQLPDESPSTPRTLLIQGPPGTGKTEVSLRAALAIGTAVMLLPPSIFSSKHEGGGVEQLTEALQEAERFSHANRTHIAVLLDDVDHSILSIGSGGNVGHTVNTADAIGHLQNLSSNRNLHVGYQRLPIPFVATANAASRIAPSLFRQMRARVHTHTADDDAKLELAHRLFAPTTKEERSFIDQLFKKHRKEQIAFWPALFSDYKAARIKALIRSKSFERDAVQQHLARRQPIDTQLLEQLAEACRKARPFDFLWKTSKAA